MPDIKVSIKVKKKRGPDGDFNDLAARVEAKAPLIAFRSAEKLAMTARIIAPQPPGHAFWGSDYERTGHLRSTIHRTGTGKEHTVEVGAPYAKFVEYGTRYMSANPFFHQSIALVRPVLKDEVKGWLKK